MPRDLLGRAELYALLHAGNAGDLAHYQEVCAGATSVLELGSGAGRLAMPLVEVARDVTGLELDPEFLALARSRAADLPVQARQRLSFLEGDMREFCLARSFDRVLLPYNGLYCLGGEREALACFQAIATHLRPGGEFWLDVYAVDSFHDEAPEEEPDSPDVDEPISELSVGGATLRVFEESRWQRAQQKLEVTYTFFDGDREVARHVLEHAYLLAPQIVLLLQEAGLEVAQCKGGFAGEPYGEDAEFLVLAATATS